MLRLASIVVLVPIVALAQSSGGSFSITHSVIDPSGPTVHGGAFTLEATVGQPDAGALSAGAFQLTGGFNATAHGDDIFRNGFEH
jgi:hypothetical protein